MGYLLGRVLNRTLYKVIILPYSGPVVATPATRHDAGGCEHLRLEASVEHCAEVWHHHACE